MTLTLDEKLLLARNRLHGLESDRFSMSLTPSTPNIERTLATYDEQIAEVEAVVAALEAEAAEAAPVEPVVDERPSKA